MESDGELSWWYSGWESACQCRGHWFGPWLRKIPLAVEQLSQCATTTTEPMSFNYWVLLPSVFPRIRVLSNESVLHIRWPKYWSFSSSPSNEYSGLISHRVDWLDLLAVQGTLKSLLQHHNSKASILWCPAFLTVQLAHPYMMTGKTIALIIQTFVGKVTSPF